MTTHKMKDEIMRTIKDNNDFSFLLFKILNSSSYFHIIFLQITHLSRENSVKILSKGGV